MIWPLIGKFIVTSRYGSRIDPKTKQPAFHYGIDIDQPDGSPVIAPADGIVKTVRWSNESGNVVRLSHDGGYETEFHHLQDSSVSVGDRVSQGALIGHLGNTGWRTTGGHLHFMVYHDGKTVDPNMVVKDSGGVAVAAYRKPAVKEVAKAGGSLLLPVAAVAFLMLRS